MSSDVRLAGMAASTQQALHHRHGWIETENSLIPRTALGAIGFDKDLECYEELMSICRVGGLGG